MINFEIMLNPEKHGYQECSHCNGYGSSLQEDAEKCTKCGGAGLTKKIDTGYAGRIISQANPWSIADDS